MPDMTIFWDIMGYVGMAFVLISFLMPKMVWLRVLNMVGSGFSLAYGIATRTFPTAALNGALLLINSFLLAHWLIQSYKAKKVVRDDPVGQAIAHEKDYIDQKDSD
jgi:hypothetical protein